MAQRVSGGSDGRQDQPCLNVGAVFEDEAGDFKKMSESAGRIC